MAGYIVFFFIGMSGCILLSAIHKKTGKGDLPKTQLIFLGILLVLLSSLRKESVGVDTSSYHSVFSVLGWTPLTDKIPFGYSGYPGYRLLCKLVYVLSDRNYRVMMTVISVIIVYGFLKFFYKRSDHCLMSAVYFITLYFFLNSLNIHRQYTAMALMLLAFLAFDEGKKFKGVFLAAAAVSVHTVSIIMPVYMILKKIRWTKPRFILYSALVASAQFIGKYAIDLFVAIFPRYSFYLTYTWYYSQTRKFSTSMIYLMMIVFAMVFFTDKMFCALDASAVRCPDRTQAEPLWVFMALTVIDVILRYLYPIDSSSVYPRIQSLFSFYSVLFIPGVIERVSRKWRPWLYFGSNVIFIYATVVRILANNGGVYPYRFFWQ